MMKVFIGLACLFAVVASTRADTAARLYERGQFKDAYERYKQAAERQTENWPLQYNLGAAAYKAGQLDDSVKAFERALAANDPGLQQKSFYNLGNSYFRIGEAAEKQSPDQALPVYERSLKSYESALTLGPKDDDARFNLDVVKKKIEELKKKQEEQKQQQQQQNQSDQKKNQDQQNQKSADQKQDQQQQQSEQSQQEKQSQTQQDPQKEEQQKQKQSAQQQQQQESAKEQPARPDQEQKLDRTEARMLLDNLREDERNWNFFPELQMKDLKEAGEPAKDW